MAYTTFDDLQELHQRAIDLNLPEEVYAQMAYARGLAVGRAHNGQGGMFAFTQDLEKLTNDADAAGLSNEERELVFADFAAGGLLGAEHAIEELTEEKAAVIAKAQAIEELFEQAEATDEETKQKVIESIHETAREIQEIKTQHLDANIPDAYALRSEVTPDYDPYAVYSSDAENQLEQHTEEEAFYQPATADAHADQIEQDQEYKKLEKLVEQYNALEKEAEDLTPGSPEHDDVTARLSAMGDEIASHAKLPQFAAKLEEASTAQAAQRRQIAAALDQTDEAGDTADYATPGSFDRVSGVLNAAMKIRDNAKNGKPDEEIALNGQSATAFHNKQRGLFGGPGTEAGMEMAAAAA